jgi:hypothetical protein
MRTSFRFFYFIFKTKLAFTQATEVYSAWPPSAEEERESQPCERGREREKEGQSEGERELRRRHSGRAQYHSRHCRHTTHTYTQTGTNDKKYNNIKEKGQCHVIFWVCYSWL